MIIKKLAIFFVLLGTAAFGQKNMSFSYSISVDQHTSAGVFDKDGALIRTLWSNKPQLAGTYYALWDGKTDAGVAVDSSGPWTVKALHSSVVYHWDGPIGDTSDHWTDSPDTLGARITHPAVQTNLRMAFVGNRIWMVQGYAEGAPSIRYSEGSNLNTVRVPDNRYINNSLAFTAIDTDGRYLYLTQFSLSNSVPNYVTKFDANSFTPAAFSMGTNLLPASTTQGGSAFIGIPLNAIAIAAFGQPPPNGIAVQNSGQLLAVAYPKGNVVNFYDKTTGISVGTPLTIANPLNVGFTTAGLWVLSGTSVVFVTNPSGSNTASNPIRGLSNAIFLTTNKANNHVYLLDGGASQQAKEFTEKGILVRTYGDLGGYSNFNPTVTNTRMILDETVTKGKGAANQSWLQISPNNELWICDEGNGGRILHVSADNKLINIVQFQNNTYTLSVSQTQPTRLYRGGLEYAIDYSKALQPGDPTPANGGNGAWALIRNWRVGAEGANGSPSGNFDVLANGQCGILGSELLSNGRVYAHTYSGGDHIVREVELPTSGPMRFISIIANNNVESPLQTNGDLLYMNNSGSAPNLTVFVKRAVLTGFDGSNNPIRNALTTLASVPVNATLQTYYRIGWAGNVAIQNATPTTTGVYPVFTSAPIKLNAFHLSGMIPGRSTYLFGVMPEKLLTRPDYMGGFSTTAGFGGHSGITAQSVGNNIFASYDGQYAQWGNQQYHYWTDGLMVGQYGVAPSISLAPAQGQLIPSTPQVAGLAGNISTTRWVNVLGEVYSYLVTESNFGPVQRWHISNLNSIVEELGTGNLGDSLTLK